MRASKSVASAVAEWITLLPGHRVVASSKSAELILGCSYLDSHISRKIGGLLRRWIFENLYKGVICVKGCGRAEAMWITLMISASSLPQFEKKNPSSSFHI